MKKEILKAYENLEFLNSHDARPIRVLCELIESSVRLEKEKISNTLVFFGSARSKSLNDTAKEFEKLHSGYPDEKSWDQEIKKKFNKAQRLSNLAKYYEDAEKLAEKLAAWSDENFSPEEQYHICSGGGPGMMEAANKGANQAGAKSLALGISLPFEQGVNSYASPELSFEFHYFFIRKFYFLYHAKAVIVFPGGYGTMDELFEALTLIQTGKIGKKIPIYLYGKEFWSPLINFNQFVDYGVISPEDLDLFKLVDQVDDAFSMITNGLKNNLL